MKQHAAALRKISALISSAKDPDDMKQLLKDILTPQEIESIAQRLEIVRHLSAGETQRSIAKKLGVSITLVTRGSALIKYGTGTLLKFLMKKH